MFNFLSGFIFTMISSAVRVWFLNPLLFSTPRSDSMPERAINGIFCVLLFSDSNSELKPQPSDADTVSSFQFQSKSSLAVLHVADISRCTH